MKKLIHTGVPLLLYCWGFSSGVHGLTPPAPKLLTPEEKVMLSDYVVIGIGKRVFCTMRDPKDPLRIIETAEDECHVYTRGVTSNLEVTVTEVLCGDRKADLPKEITVTIPGGFVAPDENRRRYINKELLYFLKKGIEASKRVRTDIMEFTRARRIADPEDASELPKFQPFVDKHCRLP